MATVKRAESSKTAAPGNVLLVVHEFSARSPDELSLAKGDRIELIEKDDDFGDGWYLGRHLKTGSTGLFPEVYTTIAPKASSDQLPVQPSPSAGAVQAPTPAATQATAQIPAQSLNSVIHSIDTGIATQSNATRSLSSAYQQRPSPTQASPRDMSSVVRLPSHNSAVMTETLSVIDEHITDMNKPGTAKRGVASSHTSRDGERLSYIAGSETEEEEEAHRHTQAEVLAWTPARVAEYLEDVGVEKRHCEVFREQEFSGEAILTMEQSTIFLKELDLGPIGRRLKTWGKIRALQDEIKAPAPATKSRHTSDTSNRQGTQSPLGIISNVAGHHSSRPSAASLRSYNQSKRTSSVEMGSTEQSPIAHFKQGSQQSLDRGWTMSSANRSTSNIPDTRASHTQSVVSDRPIMDRSGRESQVTLSTNNELDRGYMSGGELEIGGRNRRILRKKSPSAEHARQSSYETNKRRLSFFSKKSSRAPSPTGSRDISAPGSVIQSDTNGQRIVSEPLMENGAPIVTRLEYESESPRAAMNPTIDTTKPEVSKSDFGSNIRKGLRATSDAITGREKAVHRIPVDIISPTSDTAQSPRSSTPSAISHDENGSIKATTPGGLPAAQATRKKSKKSTSAYVLGLEKKTPQEQMQDAEFSGWMKKKSSNLMTNWKPRFFVLKGRRLSYYYSEQDTEEKGLIDISGHRVLAADNERLTGLHASLTGAKQSASPSSLQGGSITTSPTAIDGTDLSLTTTTTMSSTSGSKDSGQGFIFKLVPPRTGMSKAVNFTKPAVHYFAVPTLEEGRLWMAALMKATIDRDESADVVTTYQQKTISLAKARARKERPPALKNVDEEGQTSAGQDETNGESNGLLQEPTRVVSASESTVATSPPGDLSVRDQVTPVTDLETQFSRARTNSSGRIRALKEKSTRSGSNDGLGIDVEGNSPILSRMQQSGLW